MGLIDEATRKYLDEHFLRLYDEIKALRKDDSTHAVSLAEISITQQSHASDLKEIKSRQWHGVMALLASLAALFAQFVSSKLGGH